MKRFRVALALFVALLAGPLAAVGLAPSSARPARTAPRPTAAANTDEARRRPVACDVLAADWSPWSTPARDLAVQAALNNAWIATARDVLVGVDHARRVALTSGPSDAKYVALAADARHSLGSLEALRINAGADGLPDERSRRAIRGLPGAPDLALAYLPQSWRLGERPTSLVPVVSVRPSAHSGLAWRQLVEAAEVLSQRFALVDPGLVDALWTVIAASRPIPRIETAVRPARLDWLVPDSATRRSETL